MSLALDGSVASYANGSTNPVIVALTTTAAGVIVVVTLSNDRAPNDVANDKGLTFGQRASIEENTGHFLSVWTAPSSGAWSPITLNVGFDIAPNFSTVHAFGISGTPASNVFDTHAGLPVTDNTAPADPLSISTDNANDFIFGAFRMAGTANPTAGAGWNEIFGSSGGGFLLTEYKIVSATQSGLSVTITTGVGDSNGGIADAIIATAAATEPAGPSVTLYRPRLRVY